MSVLAWGRRGTATPSLNSESEALRWLTIVCLGDYGRSRLRCVSFYLLSVGCTFLWKCMIKEATYSDSHGGYKSDGRSRNLVYG